MATELKPVEDATEVIEPTVEERLVTIGQEENGTQMEFVQRPLSFFGKMDFFSVMGRALDRAMSGPDGISLGDLMDAPQTATDIRDADMFVRGIAKLASHAPEIVGDLYCVILAVPRGQREFAREVMGLPEQQGGLTDEQGISILEVFVDQNWEVLTDFFGRFRGVAQKVGEKVAPASESSKPSKTTRRSTRKGSES